MHETWNTCVVFSQILSYSRTGDCCQECVRQVDVISLTGSHDQECARLAIFAIYLLRSLASFEKVRMFNM